MPGFALPQLLLATLVQLCTAPLYVPAAIFAVDSNPHGLEHLPEPSATWSDDSTETALRAGATLTLTLHGDAWADGIGDDNAPTEALLAALRGASLRSPVAAPFRPFGWAGAEPRGWNATVAPLLDRTRLSVSGASLAIALPALPCFDLHAPEVLVAHLPAAAIASQRPISTPALHVRADATITPPRWGSVSAPPDRGRALVHADPPPLGRAAPHGRIAPRALRPRDPKRRRGWRRRVERGRPARRPERLGRPRPRRALLGARARTRWATTRAAHPSPATRRRPSCSTEGGAPRVSLPPPGRRWAAPSSAAATST